MQFMDDDDHGAAGSAASGSGSGSGSGSEPPPPQPPAPSPSLARSAALSEVFDVGDVQCLQDSVTLSWLRALHQLCPDLQIVAGEHKFTPHGGDVAAGGGVLLGPRTISHIILATRVLLTVGLHNFNYFKTCAGTAGSFLTAIEPIRGDQYAGVLEIIGKYGGMPAAVSFLLNVVADAKEYEPWIIGALANASFLNQSSTDPFIPSRVMRRPADIGGAIELFVNSDQGRAFGRGDLMRMFPWPECSEIIEERAAKTRQDSKDTRAAAVAREAASAMAAYKKRTTTMGGQAFVLRREPRDSSAVLESQLDPENSRVVLLIDTSGSMSEYMEKLKSFVNIMMSKFKWSTVISFDDKAKLLADGERAVLGPMGQLGCRTEPKLAFKMLFDLLRSRGATGPKIAAIVLVTDGDSPDPVDKELFNSVMALSLGAKFFALRFGTSSVNFVERLNRECSVTGFLDVPAPKDTNVDDLVDKTLASIGGGSGIERSSRTIIGFGDLRDSYVWPELVHYTGSHGHGAPPLPTADEALCMAVFAARTDWEKNGELVAFLRRLLADDKEGIYSNIEPIIGAITRGTSLEIMHAVATATGNRALAMGTMQRRRMVKAGVSDWITELDEAFTRNVTADVLGLKDKRRGIICDALDVGFSEYRILNGRVLRLVAMHVDRCGLSTTMGAPIIVRSLIQVKEECVTEVLKRFMDAQPTIDPEDSIGDVNIKTGVEMPTRFFDRARTADDGDYQAGSDTVLINALFPLPSQMLLDTRDPKLREALYMALKPISKRLLNQLVTGSADIDGPIKLAPVAVACGISSFRVWSPMVRMAYEFLVNVGIVGAAEIDIVLRGVVSSGDRFKLKSGAEFMDSNYELLVRLADAFGDAPTRLAVTSAAQRWLASKCEAFTHSETLRCFDGIPHAFGPEEIYDELVNTNGTFVLPKTPSRLSIKHLEFSTTCLGKLVVSRTDRNLAAYGIGCIDSLTTSDDRVSEVCKVDPRFVDAIEASNISVYDIASDRYNKYKVTLGLRRDIRACDNAPAAASIIINAPSPADAAVMLFEEHPDRDWVVDAIARAVGFGYHAIPSYRSRINKAKENVKARAEARAKAERGGGGSSVGGNYKAELEAERHRLLSMAMLYRCLLVWAGKCITFASEFGLQEEIDFVTRVVTDVSGATITDEDINATMTKYTSRKRAAYLEGLRAAGKDDADRPKCARLVVRILMLCGGITLDDACKMVVRTDGRFTPFEHVKQIMVHASNFDNEHLARLNAASLVKIVKRLNGERMVHGASTFSSPGATGAAASVASMDDFL